MTENYIYLIRDRSKEPCPWGKDKVSLVSKKMDSEGKMWLAWQLIARKQTVKDLSARYKISARTLYRYKKTVSVEKKVLLADGRPKRLSLRDMKEIERQVSRVQATTKIRSMKKKHGDDSRGRSNSRFLMENDEFMTLVKDLSLATSVARTGLGPSQHQPLSRRSIGRLKKQLNIHTAKAEQTTEAREKAVADIRNAITFAALLDFVY